LLQIIPPGWILIFIQFCFLVDWQWSTRVLGQIWLQITKESRNFWHITMQHAGPSSLNLAISQFFPSKYGDFGKKIPRKNLCMKNL
jgi:hypothetical protein